jgi:adenylate kinase family enzyme
MKRIIIIGSGGAGKSTLARRLSAITGIPATHLDSLYWQPGWKETDKAAWRQMNEDLIRQDSWLIDGNYGGTIDIRLAAADTIVFLDMPRLVCLYGVIARWLHHRGRTRPDMAAGCPEKIDWAFLVWVWNYRVRSRPKVLAKMKEYEDRKQVVVLRSRREVERWLEALTKG